MVCLFTKLFDQMRYDFLIGMDVKADKLHYRLDLMTNYSKITELVPKSWTAGWPE